MTFIGNYDEIMSDKKLFNSVVYTPLSEALEILEERRNNKDLVSKVTELLNGNIPECLNTGDKCGVQFRQIATPNVDGLCFVSIAQDNKLKPVFFEYVEDKFTYNNNFKHSLGQLRIHGGVNKNGDYPTEKITIVDFNKSNGHKIKDVKTLWEESLVDFHRSLFTHHGINKDDLVFYDASEWFKNNGEQAINYYTNFFLLFTCFGILFENFLILGDEGDFSRNIMLPALDKAIELSGVKPLIVPVPPMDYEDDEHWVSYHPKVKDLIKK